MFECKVKIIEIVDDSFYPGIVSAVLTDSSGKEHIIFEKPPIFGFELSDVEKLPFESSVCCEMIEDLGDHAVIDIDRPDHVEAEDGSHIFTVPKSSLAGVKRR